ncbi:amiloride-sensitive sodium channel domain-containing protein [Phthorimaea operculella]|nr:amiloride-sensitive sodium channel domain-containing protein [Phthorimaea operculella]
MVHYIDKSLDKKFKTHHDVSGKEQPKKMGFFRRKFVEFCKRTDLHGYKYIVMKDLNLFERTCWAAAVLASTVCAAYFVFTAYNWYARNPIVTVIESTQGAIWDIPFPAVTICNFNVISRRAARQFADTVTLPANMTSDDVFEALRLTPLLHSTYLPDPEHKAYLYQLQAVLELNSISIESMFTKGESCRRGIAARRLTPLLHSTYLPDPEHKAYLYQLQAVLELNSISIESMFTRLSPASTCGQLVKRCIWKNTVYRCDMLFQQVYTFFSVCCSFNYFATTDSASSKRAVAADARDTIEMPRRVASCGYQTALTVLLDTQPDDYYSSSVASQGALLVGRLAGRSGECCATEQERGALQPSCGYQTALTVLLDTQPDDYYSSSVASQGALVFIDNAYNIADIDSPVRVVNPSSEVLIALSPERTYTTAGIRAFSPSERQCYFSDEVQIGNFRQYSYHNCIAHQRVDTIRTVCDCVPYYFQLKENARTCNFNDLDCLQGFVGNYMNHTRSGKLTESKFVCLPECEHYDYPLEVALGKLAANVRLDELPFFSDVRLDNHSLVNVFFNDLVSTRYRRDVYLNWQNLLASFGGLLSLMLGFTLISGFDLLLFFTFGLAYRLVTERPDDDQPQKTGWVKDNRINVQEYQQQKKRNSSKAYGKWNTEIPYGVQNFPKRY